MAIANEKVTNVEIVRLSEIEIDPKFNARSNVETSVGGDDSEKGGFAGLCNSIMTDGQDTPVILRKNPKASKHPYSLVAGFRRAAALQKIYAEKGTPEKGQTIKAEIRDMTDEQARMTNVRENTARDDLGGPDLCFGIGAILATNKDLSSVTLASGLGMNQSYVAKMMRIWANVGRGKADGGPILKDWRESVIKLTNNEMDALGKLPPDEQTKAYADAKAKKKADRNPDKNPDKWIDGAMLSAGKVGHMLGRLSRDGHLEIVGDDFFGANIRTLVSFKADATQAQIEKLSGAAEKGFSDGQEADETEAEKEAAKAAKAAAKAAGVDPKVGAAKKKSGAAKKNGAKVASAN